MLLHIIHTSVWCVLGYLDYSVVQVHLAPIRNGPGGTLDAHNTLAERSGQASLL